MKSGNLNFLEPCGPLQACNGTALFFNKKLRIEAEGYRSKRLKSTQQFPSLSKKKSKTCNDLTRICTLLVYQAQHVDLALNVAVIPESFTLTVCSQWLHEYKVSVTVCNMQEWRAMKSVTVDEVTVPREYAPQTACVAFYWQDF